MDDQLLLDLLLSPLPHSLSSSALDSAINECQLFTSERGREREMVVEMMEGVTVGQMAKYQLKRGLSGRV